MTKHQRRAIAREIMREFTPRKKSFWTMFLDLFFA